MAQQTINTPGSFEVRPVGAGPGYYARTYLNNLNGITLQEFAAQYKGRIKKAKNFNLFDTRIVLKDGTIAAGEYDFFTKQIGQTESTLDGGATITKTDDLTNMKEPNKVALGKVLIITSFQVRCNPTAREFASVAGGRPTSAAPAAAGTTSACNNLVALDRGGIFRVEIGDDEVSEGRLLDYPPKAHMSGAFGSVDDEGFAQSGSGCPNYLDEIVILPGQQLFFVKWKFPVDLIVAQNMQIEFGMHGILIEGVS